MTSIGELRRRTLENLKRPSYSIDKRGMVLLNDNSNQFGVNPAIQEVAESFDFGRLWAYPSENSDALRSRIASEHGVEPDEVIVGNGSDELLDITTKTFINPGDKFCCPEPTFRMYKFYAKINFASIQEKRLGPDFSLDADDILSENAKLTAMCQPNNPTGNLLDPIQVRRVLSDSSGIVLLDEAYCDFCDSNMMGDVLACERGIDVRTFSKAYGLAGLRAGYAIARKEIVDELRLVRTPFGLNSFTEAVAMRALDNKGWVSEVVSKVKIEREYLDARMTELGFRTYPSVCSFILAECPCDASTLVSSLKEKEVAIRDFSAYPMMENHVRVTVGPRALMDRFLEAAQTILER